MLDLGLLAGGRSASCVSRDERVDDRRLRLRLPPGAVVGERGRRRSRVVALAEKRRAGRRADRRGARDDRVGEVGLEAVEQDRRDEVSRRRLPMTAVPTTMPSASKAAARRGCRSGRSRSRGLEHAVVVARRRGDRCRAGRASPLTEQVVGVVASTARYVACRTDRGSGAAGRSARARRRARVRRRRRVGRVEDAARRDPPARVALAVDVARRRRPSIASVDPAAEDRVRRAPA